MSFDHSNSISICICVLPRPPHVNREFTTTFTFRCLVPLQKQKQKPYTKFSVFVAIVPFRFLLLLWPIPKLNTWICMYTWCVCRIQSPPLLLLLLPYSVHTFNVKRHESQEIVTQPKRTYITLCFFPFFSFFLSLSFCSSGSIEQLMCIKHLHIGDVGAMETHILCIGAHSMCFISKLIVRRLCPPRFVSHSLRGCRVSFIQLLCIHQAVWNQSKHRSNPVGFASCYSLQCGSGINSELSFWINIYISSLFFSLHQN